MTEFALQPAELIVLQGTSFCNLNCGYCDLSPQSRRRRRIMEPTLLERLFAQLFASDRLAPEVTVVWHSGEPPALPPAYYDDAIERILRLRDTACASVAIGFDIQTNGVHPRRRRFRECRMGRQFGWFTRARKPDPSLERHVIEMAEPQALVKLVMPAGEAMRALDDLDRMGINAGNLFADLEGAAQNAFVRTVLNG
jgi:hypothetical protein